MEIWNRTPPTVPIGRWLAFNYRVLTAPNVTVRVNEMSPDPVSWNLNAYLGRYIPRERARVVTDQGADQTTVM